MNFKKRVNGSWHDAPHYVHNTSTDTITTLPAVLYPNDTTATVGLKGNTAQNGTPTPDSPAMPQGTGERTGNLWNEEYTGISSSLTYVPVYVGDGTFTLSTSCPAIERAAALFFLAGNVQSGASTYSNGVYDNRPITITSSNGYVTIAYRYVAVAIGSADPRNEKTMLNTGSTTLPYEPYGYKLNISSASTTTPVYLGEVETTRKIRKVVFDGTERWNLSKQGNNTRVYTPQIPECLSLSPALCTHFAYNVANVGYPRVGEFVINSSKAIIIGVDGNAFADVDAWKAYLAQQYTAGTPVTVWYILAAPETAVVNEPLRKIGDYADEVSGISIPVTAGGDTISVDTTLQPSEVTVNYKGWHPAIVHERTNGAWT